eukprot:CAMPEP_0202687630 /NCGR_PEP_ID=MMETSP1385-20130828/3288_1 /ASSEMBLY_ACC=CAM_ASM_000861 /TAXON_ID=933848 /ORGANISM="Elphidium margaritaceum" /LENGTH=197 /DNA_ID=CAMNT_0049342457 /DNA_START=51 /DNA_END=644 /DNA_ORIENTATION=+
MLASVVFFSAFIALNNAALVNQVIDIKSTRDIGANYTLVINADTEMVRLIMTGDEGIWMAVIFGAEDMFNASSYVYSQQTDNDWVLAERWFTDEGDAGTLIAEISTDDYTVSTTDGRTTVVFDRTWAGSTSTEYEFASTQTEFEYGFARGLDAALANHGGDGRSHEVATLQHDDDDAGSQYSVFWCPIAILVYIAFS